jgi:hypothetical protein
MGDHKARIKYGQHNESAGWGQDTHALKLGVNWCTHTRHTDEETHVSTSDEMKCLKCAFGYAPRVGYFGQKPPQTVSQPWCLRPAKSYISRLGGFAAIERHTPTWQVAILKCLQNILVHTL